MTNNMPAPDANERLVFPAPAEAAKQAAPESQPLLSPAPVDQAPAQNYSSQVLNSLASPKAAKPIDNALALIVAIAGFMLSIIPFIGLVLAGVGLLLGIKGLQTNLAKRKFFVWTVVLSALGLLSALSYTSSFVQFIAGH